MFDSDMRAQIAITAKSLNVLPAALLAVVEVESGGRIGAKVNGRMEPMIRFEGHYFYRLLPKSLRMIARTQKLAHPKAGRVVNPRAQARRWTKLERAIKINRIAALSSVSWGVGQVMGAHWKWLGYGSVDALVQEARSGLSGQVRLMARFIQKSGLVSKLNSQDWAGFARIYNGPGYRKNRYHEKMAKAFLRYQRSGVNWVDQNVNSSVDVILHDKPLLKMRSRGRAVRTLQQLLSENGYLLMVDGKFGRRTRDAVEEFQQKNELITDGIVGKNTWERLSNLTGTLPVDAPQSNRSVTIQAKIIQFFRRLFRL